MGILSTKNSAKLFLLIGLCFSMPAFCDPPIGPTSFLGALVFSMIMPFLVLWPWPLVVFLPAPALWLVRFFQRKQDEPGAFSMLKTLNHWLAIPWLLWAVWVGLVLLIAVFNFFRLIFTS
jgi:hypothetical protein